MVDLNTYPLAGYTGNWQDFIPVVTKDPLGDLVPLWNCYNDDDAPALIPDDDAGCDFDWYWNSVPQNLTGCDKVQVRLYTSAPLDMVYIQLQSWDGVTYTNQIWPGRWRKGINTGEFAPVYANYIPDWDPYVMLEPLGQYSINNPNGGIGPGFGFLTCGADAGWNTIEFSLKRGAIWPVYEVVDVPQVLIESCWWVWLSLWGTNGVYYTFKVPYIAGVRSSAF